MTHRTVADPVLGTAQLLVVALAAPGPPLLDCAPLDDAESRRGRALLEESRLSAEVPARLARDRARLFVGDAGRAPIAPLAAPAPAVPALTRLRDAMAAAGLPVPDVAVDLLAVLRMYAVLGPARPGESAAVARWREELLDEHLLDWGPGCLTRMQLGAQTFFYQGVAALGLGLLRHLAREHRPSVAS